MALRDMYLLLSDPNFNNQVLYTAGISFLSSIICGASVDSGA